MELTPTPQELSFFGSKDVYCLSIDSWDNTCRPGATVFMENVFGAIPMIIFVLFAIPIVIAILSRIFGRGRVEVQGEAQEISLKSIILILFASIAVSALFAYYYLFLK